MCFDNPFCLCYDIARTFQQRRKHMEKFIPYEKLSKKKQRELNAMKRVTWGSFNPVTRKPANPKAYNRRTAQRWKDDSSFVPFLVCVKILLLSQKLIS